MSIPKSERLARRSPSTRRSTTPVKATTASPATVAGIAISHPDKVYFPDEAISKIDVARYYESVASWILPHIANRPLALVRCPDGWKGQCFYQKHADKSVNAAVDRIQVPEGKGTATYMGAASAKALVALVQWGVIEMHPWGSKRPHLERPDRLIFDLDPDDSIAWKELVTAVSLLRTALEEIELLGFLKTTGGKGLHVVVPIRGTLSWDQAKTFTRGVADFLVRTFADRFTATASKRDRKGKIFIDYLRNAEGATAIAPYGVRARAGAPISMPISWNELTNDVRFDHFNLRNAEDSIRSRKGDPWREYSTTKQAITKTQARKLGFAL